MLAADGSDLLHMVSIDSYSPGAGHGIAIDEAGDIYCTGAMNARADVYIAKLPGMDPVAAVADWDRDRSMSLVGPSHPIPFGVATRVRLRTPEGEHTILTATSSGSKHRTAIDPDVLW